MTSDITRLETQTLDRLKAAFRAIQMPRTPFVLEHFVAGQHDGEPARYAQVVLELQDKYYAVRRAQIGRARLVDRIAALRRRLWWPVGRRERAREVELLELDLEQQDLAVLGAIREAAALLELWQSFDRQYTREELNAAQPEYWMKRLTRQANQDVTATGRVGVGNQEALRQIGMAVTPELNHVREIERRFLETGDVKVLVAIPTLIPRETVETGGLDCLQGWSIPGTIQRKIFVVTDRPVDDAYNEAARQALQDGADFLLCVEDDVRAPADAFTRLWSLYEQQGPKAVVGAWYPMRKEPRTGTPIVVQDGRRTHLDDDGAVHEVYAIPQGFTLIPTRVFLEVEQPWFQTTTHLTQDSFFSQAAREAGYRLLVDTSTRCRHIDRETGRVYE